MVLDPENDRGQNVCIAGLIHRAIIMSGSVSAGWSLHRQGPPDWDVKNIIKYLKCEKMFDAEETKELLRHTSATASGKCNLLEDDTFSCPPEASGSDSEALIECLRTKLNFTDNLFTQALTMEV